MKIFDPASATSINTIGLYLEIKEAEKLLVLMKELLVAKDGKPRTFDSQNRRIVVSLDTSSTMDESIGTWSKSKPIFPSDVGNK